MDDANHNRSDEGAELEAPTRLVATLRKLQPPPPFVPSAVNQTILNAAQRHFAKAEAPRPFIPRWLWWPVSAAACVALILAVHQFNASRNHPPVFAREDLNQDGRVDILDAFQLARQLESGTQPADAPDLNQDGITDRRDVEALATQAVKLEKGGRS